MKIIFKLVFLALFFSKTVSAAEQVLVPQVGATWESELVYKAVDENIPVRRKVEKIVVDRHLDGRPVFRGEVFGYTGEIMPSSSGTVVYTDECKGDVKAEMLVPPEVPNQCVWGVCNAPSVGQTFTRQMIFYVPLYACQAKVATYTFTALRTEMYKGQTVTVGDAKVAFGTLRQTTWHSYVKDGVGEIYAESSGRVTTYSKVDVPLVPYKKPAGVLVGTKTLVIEEAEVVLDQCDVVAFGDSLTEGMGVHKDQSYPVVLSSLLGKPVCNLGMSGSTTEVAKARLGEVRDLRPKVVIMTLGANDAFQGVAPEVTKKNLEQIVSTFLKENILVVALTFDGILEGSTTPKYLKQMLGVYEGLSSREGVVVLPNAFDGVFVKEHISLDGIHPNIIGYKRLANNVYEQGFGLCNVLSCR